MKNDYTETWGQRKRRERRERMALGFKVANTVLFTLMVAWMFATIFSQARLINVLQDRVALSDALASHSESTFVVTPDGEETLKVSEQKGQLVQYKGVWINSEILKQIDEKFGDNADTFKAILIVESTGSGSAVNHNCRYDKNGNLRTDGVGYSNFCKSAYHAEIGTDSVDCGYLQINVKGTKCPTGIFAPEKQVAMAYEIYSKGGCGGLNCWSSWKYNKSKIIKVLNE